MTGAKIADLRKQLLKTLTNLNAEGEFYVCFFNTVAEPMPHPTWVKAGGPEAEKVKTWVQGINARGGTNPMPAFEVAFKLTPPPDVIFFMTDGQFDPGVAARVVALNGTPRKTVVNTIMFGTNFSFPVRVFGVRVIPIQNLLLVVPVMPPVPKVMPKMGIGEDLLKKIAEQNGGTFTRYAPP
jgi:hypothetical protein